MLKSSDVCNWSPKTREEKGADVMFEEIIVENISISSISSLSSISSMNLKQDKYKKTHT